MASTEVVFKCPKEAVKCFFFKLLPESGFPKATGVVLVLNVLFHSASEFFIHGIKFRHSTEGGEGTMAYLESEVPQLQVRFSCNSGVSLSTVKFSGSKHPSCCMPRSLC